METDVGRAVQIDHANAPYSAFMLRVAMGILFIMHGVYLKAIVFGMPGTVGYFTSLGLPGWLAWVVMLYETIGGIMLILGIYVRWVAAFLGVHLLIATFMVHWKNGWVFTAQGGGFEYPLFWAIVCFALALMGSGAYTVRTRVAA